MTDDKAVSILAAIREAKETLRRLGDADVLTDAMDARLSRALAELSRLADDVEDARPVGASMIRLAADTGRAFPEVRS